MPARLIRDGVMESERVLSVPVEARWLFVIVILSADDMGLFEATAFKLARRADVSRDLGDKLLGMLADVDLIRLYEVGGKRYGFVPRFRQRLQIKRLKHPPPPEALLLDEPDALRKIKHLAAIPTAGQRISTAAQPPEPEPEVEDKRHTESSSTSRGAPSTPAKPARKGAKKPSARVAPVDFLIDGSLQRWAREAVPLVDIKAETEIFRRHEFARARLDWPKTWQNWMLKEQKRLAALRTRAGSGKSFRERDAAFAAQEASKWGGGLVADRSLIPATDILDMETPHERLDSD